MGEEGVKVAKALRAPDDYLLASYIGLGYPLEDRPMIEQVECSAEKKMHLGKW